MRTVATKLVGLCVTSLLATGPALAVPDEDLAEMHERLRDLEQRVEAQREQIEHQTGLLEDAQRVVRERQQEQRQTTLSGVGEFWQAIDVNMSVAGSYAYNFHDPSNTPGGSGAGQNAGRSGLFYLLHPDHNSFQVDQVWFDIGKEPTEESRAGIHATILFGTTAGLLGQGSPGLRRTNFDSTSDYYVHQAYVSYLAPLGPGVEVTFGKFATLVGVEVGDASKNWNITRGNLATLLQPIDHVGVLTSTDIGPVTLAAGVVNQIDVSTSSPDVNSEKSYLGTIGMGTDTFGVTGTVAYGAEGFPTTDAFGGNTNQRRTGLVDLLGTYESAVFSAWLNADYAWVEGRQPSAWGIALAGQVSLTEVLSAALRLEYLRDKGTGATATEVDFFAVDFFGIGTGFNHSEIYGITGTLAYELARNLTLKGEVRYDRVVEENFAGPEEFLTNTSNGDNDQVVGLAQGVYAF